MTRKDTKFSFQNLNNGRVRITWASQDEPKAIVAVVMPKAAIKQISEDEPIIPLEHPGFASEVKEIKAGNRGKNSKFIAHVMSVLAIFGKNK